MKVQNKVIVVTGGGNGIGRELVLNLLSKGTKVVAIDINEAALIETRALAGVKEVALTTFVVNITDKSAVRQLVKDVIAVSGHVDGIINNAGIIQPFVKFNNLSYDVIDRVINVNLFGTLYMVKEFLPELLCRPVAHIINISSMGGFLPVPGQTIYGAAKAAVKLMTEGLSAELSKTNVRVSVVFPGAIRTNIMTNSGLDNTNSSTDQGAAKILSPVDAADIIVNGIESDNPRILVGNDAKFMDFFYRLSPSGAIRLITKKMQSRLSL